MRRREFIAVLGVTAFGPRSARAQQPAKPVVGFLNVGRAEPALTLPPLSAQD